MRLPPDHPQRQELNDEVHARPPESLTAPSRLSFLALVSDPAQRSREEAALAELAAAFGVAPPVPGVSHYRADLGAFRLKWERHSEFARYKLIVPGTSADPFAEPAIAAVPADWVAALPGQVIAATHVAFLPEADPPWDLEEIAARLFGGHALVGALVAGGAARAFTDFRLHGDGFGRLLVLDRGMSRRQAGRMVQRLLEIDTYRMMALLALPLARSLQPILTTAERELAQVASALADAREEDEQGLLDRLSALEAVIERHLAQSHFRFGAARAYDELVQRRVAELREERIQGLQTFRELIERRLAPAMSTCRTVAARQESASERVARATGLLSTRVGISRERQNQALLESMNRRAKLQLRLQQTVEGLSVAAITYYVVGLVGYAAKGLKALGVTLDPEVVTAVSVLPVALLVGLGIHRIRQIVTRRAGPA